MENSSLKMRRMTVTAIFIALGIMLSPIVSFPFGGARVFPLQHMINVLLVLLVGWQYSVAGAFCISSIRIGMGTGTLLAYPGSMIGAFVSGIIYKKTGSVIGAVLGEIIGTGILGGLISYPVSAFVFDSHAMAAWYFIVAFLPNTILGGVAGGVLYKVLPSQRLLGMIYGNQHA